MRVKLKSGQDQRKFIERIEELSGENVFACYQCGRCSAGCPMASEMDLLPNQIIRMVQMGLEDEVLRSKTLYLCASCFTCESRCPKGIDMARVMEAVCNNELHIFTHPDMRPMLEQRIDAIRAAYDRAEASPALRGAGGSD